jgi:Ulp1 family protease
LANASTARVLTYQVDLFDQDMFVFPINVQGLHWTAGVVDLRKKRIEYYDSMGDFGGIKDRYFDVSRMRVFGVADFGFRSN